MSIATIRTASIKLDEAATNLVAVRDVNHDPARVRSAVVAHRIAALAYAVAVLDANIDGHAIATLDRLRDVFE